MIGYHVVTEGRLIVAIKGEPTIEVSAGEIVLFPQNEPHTLANEVGIKSIRARELIQKSPNGGLLRIEHGGGGTATRIVCGFLASEENYNPLISALPKVLKIDVRYGASRELIETSVRFAAGELAGGQLASSSVLIRLSELLLTEAIRQYSSTLGEDEVGWLKGLKDPYVGRALALIQSQTRRALVRRNAGQRSCAVSFCLCRAFYVTRRHVSNPISHPLASSNRQDQFARNDQNHRPARALCWL